jgi:hypothetical protein
MIGAGHSVPVNRLVPTLHCLWSLTGEADRTLARKWIPGEGHPHSSINAPRDFVVTTAT